MPTTTYTVINGEIVSEDRSGTKRDYVPDPLGSTAALLDNTQAQTDTFTYWPYGEVKTRTGTNATPFQFVGTLGYYQDTAGRIYVRARYLDSNKARWTTEDPIGIIRPNANLYEYCWDNPVRVTDRFGLLPCALCYLYGGPLAYLCFRFCGPANKVYGNYCGPDWPPPHKRPPVIGGPKGLDACCQVHDDCYDGVGTGPGNMDCQRQRIIGVPPIRVSPKCRGLYGCDSGLCHCAKNADCGWSLDCSISRQLIETWFCMGLPSPPPEPEGEGFLCGSRYI